MRKCAWVKGEKRDERCPFGLPIALACRHAGGSVAHMCPLAAVGDSHRERVALANKRIYIHHKEGERCSYAVDIMDQDPKDPLVNCDFGDVGQGTGGATFEGSPLYAQTFAGVGLDGLYAYPLGFYADNSASRNLFHGLFSLLGGSAPEIVKRAVCGDDEDLWDKIEKGDVLSGEEMGRLEVILDGCRLSFEEEQSDAVSVRELADRWNPRKR